MPSNSGGGLKRARSERKIGTSAEFAPKMNMLRLPISSAISTLEPSMVPMIKQPFMANFMLDVPDASVPAVEMCWDSSAAGTMTSALLTL